MENYIFPFLWMRGEEEQILRTEIEKIGECGIRAVCVEARPHDDFCGPRWWHDMDIVIDEARKRGMKIWILDDKHFPTGYANGLIEKKYPERKKQYIACTTADVFGAQHPLTLHVGRMLKPTIGFWEIGNPVDSEERANNTLLALIALRFSEGRLFHEDALDLTELCRDGVASFTLPEGQWRIFAIYRTRTDGGNPSYINMIDSVSAHTQIEGVYEAHYERYAQEFGKTIAGFFSDEPQFGNISDQCFDTKLGKPKMPLPWSGELEELLAERYPEGYRSLLPFLFAESREKEKEPQLRYDYMDCISKLYAKNFSRPIGQWCHDHGVEYIGHVVEDNGVHSRLGLGPAHWFRAMEGQDMAGIDVIGGQYYFGAPALEHKAMTPCDGEFFHYALGKLGASAGHLDPRKKGRTMCELFGAYGWSFGVRDMKYLLDHMLSKGINHLVPHAFSMAEYPDYDCPPHFYARGHNPEFPYFSYLMRYANRMCGMLNGGTHIASVAVLYDGELDWTGDAMPMQKICRVLTENQIEFDIVCLDMLRNLPAYQGRAADNKLTINGVAFDALLVPKSDYVPESLIDFSKAAEGFPVYFVDGTPKRVLRDEAGAAPDTAFAAGMPVISLDVLPRILTEKGMRNIVVEPAFPQLNFYHYRKGGQMLFFMNESPNQTFDGTVFLRFDGEPVLYNAMEDRFEALEGNFSQGTAAIKLTLAPGESCLIMERASAGDIPLHRPAKAVSESFTHALELPDHWKITCLKPSGETVEIEECGNVLTPVSDRYPAFSGIIRYEREVEFEQAPAKAILQAQNVYDVFSVKINGAYAGTKLTPPYQADLSGLLHEGKNTLMVEVATTPARDQLNFPMPPFDFTHEALEPTGMFGAVRLLYS